MKLARKLFSEKKNEEKSEKKIEKKSEKKIEERSEEKNKEKTVKRQKAIVVISSSLQENKVAVIKKIVSKCKYDSV